MLSSGARRALAHLAGSLGAVALEEDLADELAARGYVNPLGSGYVITAAGTAANNAGHPASASAVDQVLDEVLGEATDPLF